MTQEEKDGTADERREVWNKVLEYLLKYPDEDGLQLRVCFRKGDWVKFGNISVGFTQPFDMGAIETEETFGDDDVSPLTMADLIRDVELNCNAQILDIGVGHVPEAKRQ